MGYFVKKALKGALIVGAAAAGGAVAPVWIPTAVANMTIGAIVSGILNWWKHRAD